MRVTLVSVWIFKNEPSQLFRFLCSKAVKQIASLLFLPFMKVIAPDSRLLSPHALRSSNHQQYKIVVAKKMYVETQNKKKKKKLFCKYFGLCIPHTRGNGCWRANKV